MDRETELRLSLYLDGQLSETDRQAFEAILERDEELRRAVRLHRAAAEEMAVMPEVPAGLLPGARARWADQTEAARPAWWHRFWSLETAGLVAAALIVAAVLYPFVVSHDTLPSRKEPRDAVGISETSAVEAPILKRSDDKGSGEDKENEIEEALLRNNALVIDDSSTLMKDDQAKQKLANNLRSLGTLVEQDAETGKKPATDGDSYNFSNALEIDSTLRADSPEKAPAAGQELREEAEEIAADERRSIGARSDALGSVSSALPVVDLAYRIIPIDTSSPLNDSGYLILNTDAAWKQAGSPEPIDFSRQMAILIPTFRSVDPPIRIQVIRVQSKADGIEIWTLDVPIDPAAGADRDLGAPRQAVIVSTVDAPVRLRQGD